MDPIVSWSDTQSRRLRELGAGEAELARQFVDAGARDGAYRQLAARLARAHREHLEALRATTRRPGLCRLEARLGDALVEAGFVQVATPIIMAGGLLARMAIDRRHPLFDQIYWLGKNKCLRPMLAPHLYFILKDLLRLWERPIRLFETGPCFRRESQGSQHSSEFTMLNLVEMGLPQDQRRGRLAELAALVMGAAGIGRYRLQSVDSTVYGDTIDVVTAGDHPIELGSAAMGPHPLDDAWKIREAWVGIGFGLERLLMAVEGSRHLAPLGRSLTYLDGARLNVP
jgi:phenylalanyl-tRNA synthetase alpha chain